MQQLKPDKEGQQEGDRQWKEEIQKITATQNLNLKIQTLKNDEPDPV